MRKKLETLCSRKPKAKEMETERNKAKAVGDEKANVKVYEAEKGSFWLKKGKLVPDLFPPLAENVLCELVWPRGLRR